VSSLFVGGARLVDAPLGGIRSWYSSARVRLRRSIITPDPAPARVSWRIGASPVGVARIGKNWLPPGSLV
jgi:hypothetical protein